MAEGHEVFDEFVTVLDWFDEVERRVGQRRERAAYLVTGPGETADFELTPSTPGGWRLEVKTRLSG